MLKAKNKLVGRLKQKSILKGKLINAVKYISPLTQEKTVIPTKEIQEILPDENYTGLSKVTVEGYTPIVNKKTITENGTYNASDDNLDGYSSVEVTTSGVNINDYFTNVIPKGEKNSYNGVTQIIKNIPENITISTTDCTNMFYQCIELERIPFIDTSAVTSMSSMFYNCYKLEEIQLMDTSNVTNMSGIFYNCYKLKSLPVFNTSNVTTFANAFRECHELEEIPAFDTSNVTNLNNTFFNSTKIKTIPLLEAGKVTLVTSAFFKNTSLVNLGGLKDLGKAYDTTRSENYSSYTLDLSWSTLLTYESLMNVINNLYDIKSAGCNNQSLKLGYTNKAKLTEEEIAIATNKGWNVS